MRAPGQAAYSLHIPWTSKNKRAVPICPADLDPARGRTYLAQVTLSTAPALPFGPDAPWLAPLAGFSDLPFRLLCREHGAAAACTEMVSAKGLIMGGSNTPKLLTTCPEDQPLVVQLFGAEPEHLARAVDICRAQGFIWFDLNAGCPVPKVAKTGAGAALLQDPERLLACAAALCERAGPGRAGVKTRLGWQREKPLMPGLGPRLVQAGAAWITLHPRFAKQGFSGSADWDALTDLVHAVNVPVVASGDLFTAQDALACVRRTGVSTVMFARGALHDPTVFERFKELTAGAGGEAAPAAPDPHKLAALIRRHVDLVRAYGDERHALLAMRTMVPRYVRGLPGVRALRNSLVSCTSWQDLDQVLQEFLFGGDEKSA